MRDRSYSQFHTFLFILLCIGVALSAAFGTFFRNRPKLQRIESDRHADKSFAWNGTR